MGRLELMALAMLAAACDDEMATADKQVVNIPLTGGLDTKTGPLAQVAGSFLQLDDVRQERLHEWRNRLPITHADALDDLGSAPPLRSVEYPGGGLFGLIVSGANFNAGATYSRNVPSTIARWQQVANASCSAITPGYWRRRIAGTSQYSPYMTTVAVGNGLRFTAWKPGNASVGQDAIHVVISSDTDGSIVTAEATIGNTAGWHPKAVYDAGSQRFVLFWLDGTNVNAAKWNATTGIFDATATLKTIVIYQLVIGALGGIRTPDPQIRS